MKKLFFFLFCILFSNIILAKDDIGPHFIANQGQWNEPFSYKAYVQNGAMFFTNNSIVYSFYNPNDLEEMHNHDHNATEEHHNDKVNMHAFKIQFLNASTQHKIAPSDKKEYYHNYYLGNDKNLWKAKVPTYNQLVYTNIYDGINLIYKSSKTGIKYDFVVAPNMATEQIKMKLSGADAAIDASGNLVIKTSVGDKKELKPISYQTINGQQVEVKTIFELKNNTISFSFPNGYDKTTELIIDPVLIFSTYSGGTATTYGWSAAYDQSGHLYSGGECFGIGWPITLGSYQQTHNGGIDVSINCYEPNGTSLIYSTYYGGSSGDYPSSMVCSSNDELIIGGYTNSNNLPTTTGCYDNTIDGFNDLFIVSFDATGAALLGSTYIGGNGSEGNESHEINLDSNDNIYMATLTNSTNFPTTAGAFQTTYGGGANDGVLLKMDLNCTTLLLSTYLGGSGNDECQGVQLASNGDIITTGTTRSTNFPTTTTALHTTFQGGLADGFVTKFNNTLSTQLASTYLGTTDDDNGYRVQIDGADNIYVCGISDLYPVSTGVYSNVNGRIFIDKLDPTLSTSLLSTRLGATASTTFSFLRPTAFLLDVCENVYVSCQGANANLPLTPDAYQSTQGGLWVIVLTPNYGSLLYASYIGASGDHIDGGGSRFDPNGIIYQSMCTSSNNVHQSPGCHSPTNQSGSWDIASMKMEFGFASVTASFTKDKPDTVCVNETIQFNSASSSATMYSWDFGDGNSSSLQNPIHSYTAGGIYTVRLIAENNLASCSSVDTVTQLITVADIVEPMISAMDDTICNTDNFNLTLDVSNDNGNFSYSWTPAGAIVSGGNTNNPVVDPTASTFYTVTVTHAQYSGYCESTATDDLTIFIGDTTLMAVFPVDTTICLGQAVNLLAVGGVSYQWEPAESLDDPTSPLIIESPANNKSYEVTISDMFGCSATKYANVKVETAKANAGIDQIIRYGNSTTLDGSKSIGTIFNWLPSSTLSNINIPNPIANPLFEEEYTLTVTTPLGCTDRDNVTVFVTNFSLPNAFTPNNDNLNDEYKLIISNELIALKSFRIYNRWGQNVFYTNDKYIGWNGTFKGVPCEPGTYFYLVELSIGSEQYTYRGDVSLLR